MKPDPPRPERPVLVWVITLLYAWGALASLILLPVMVAFADALPISDAQKTYFRSLTAFDHAYTGLILVVNTFATVSLFQLRRRAYPLFEAVLGLNVASTAYQCATKNWLDAVGPAGVLGAAYGWLLLAAVVWYARHLGRTGVLR